VNPVLLVIAGPNGAGKTTVTGRLRRDHWSEGLEYLNPDEVARDRFGDWNSPQAVLDAARWTEERREALLRIGAGIAFETVFSSPGKVDFVRRAKASGYFVRFFFIGTSDPRIDAGRVMQGGHTVPIEKIVSRYERSMANLPAAIDIADRVFSTSCGYAPWSVPTRRGYVWSATRAERPRMASSGPSAHDTGARTVRGFLGSNLDVLGWVDDTLYALPS
jgi:predicted ABC-type ATPase